MIDKSFQSYIRPRPPKAGTEGSVLSRLPKVVHGFIQHSTKIREASLRDSANARFRPFSDRIMACGLAWGRELLAAPIAISIRDEVANLSVQVVHGRGSKRQQSAVLRQIKSLTEDSPMGGKGSRIWYDGKSLILSYSIAKQGGCEYFYFSKVPDLTPNDIRLVGTFGTLLEDILATAVSIEFLSDQRRLLNRRTIVAQLRPNDLLYQGLRRLHKYVGWRRDALILAPSILAKSNSDQGVAPISESQWQVVAERLRGVHETSRRVGRKYRMAAGSTPIVSDLLLPTLGSVRTNDIGVWERMVRRIVAEKKDLSEDLPPARSALAVYIQPETLSEESSSDGSCSVKSGDLAVILNDPRLNYFTEQHIDITRRLFTDIAEIVYRSGRISQRLVSLWMPSSETSPETVNDRGREIETQLEDVDEVEALDPGVLAAEAPNILSVDGIQIVQLRRSTARKVAAQNVNCLRVLALRDDKGHSDNLIPVRLLSGANVKLRITLESGELWKSIAAGHEFTHKDPQGIPSKRVFGLFSSRGAHRPFKSVFVIPIRSEGEISGAIIAYRRTPSEFADIDKLLIRGLAARVGERIELRRQLADRARHNSCLYRVAHAKTPAQARHELVRGARELLNADCAFMMAKQGDVDGNETEPSIVDVGHTWADGTMRVPPIKVGTEGITGTTYATGNPSAVQDVSTCEIYIPLRNKSGRRVPMRSELAVPIVVPSSLAGKKQNSPQIGVLGVLDTMWAQPHKITAREVRTLSGLAQHAASILQLSTNLQAAQHARDQLRALLDQVKVLQELRTEAELLNWLWSIASTLAQADVMYVWSHSLDADELKLIHRRGMGTQKLHKGETIKFNTSWTGDVIREFRRSGRKSTFDDYRKPKMGGSDSQHASSRIRIAARLLFSAHDHHAWEHKTGCCLGDHALQIETL